ncbi:RHS repeat-associated core domain-containing protein [Escherichia coli]|uniref:RHS repeat-associated core domain-containing protein n=2 Tax=Escherichia coli TaxID=562 RepID=UPI0022B3E3D3|nr:RHS repeat-associated core domain-containing protein [Escherichia coli]MCZ5920296.1 RHS domain-containing protein [Escherichia coli]
MQFGWDRYLYDAEQPYTPVAAITGRGESRKIWYYHTDLTGTVQEVTAPDGTLVWAGYQAGFGENRGDISNSGAYFEQPLRLPGQYYDEETGLHYNLFRYYAPECGRFISQDPISIRGGLNLYRYAPNPLRWIDPLGLDWNYHLTDSDGKVYYHGRASDNASMEDVARRHSNTTGADKARFGETDTMTRITEPGTPKLTAQGVEGIAIGDNTIGRRADNGNRVRGNNIRGVNPNATNATEKLNAGKEFLNGRIPSEMTGETLTGKEYFESKC